MVIYSVTFETQLFSLLHTQYTNLCTGRVFILEMQLSIKQKNSLLTTDKQSANVHTRRGIGHSASFEKSFLPTLTHKFLQMGIYTVGSCLHYIGHSSLITKFLPSTNILWSWSFLNGNICEVPKNTVQYKAFIFIMTDHNTINFWNSKFLKLSTAVHPFMQMYTHREVYSLHWLCQTSWKNN